jgi:hypothetical protein
MKLHILILLFIPNVLFAAFPISNNRFDNYNLSKLNSQTTNFLIEKNRINKQENNISDTKKGNGFGIAALSCSLAGFLFPLLGILGIVFGAIGMSKNRKLRGLAIAGFSLGILETIISVLALIIIIAFI